MVFLVDPRNHQGEGSENNFPRVSIANCIFDHFILSSIFGHFIVLLPHDPLTMSTPSKPKFSVGDRVQDEETGVLGTVVYVYDDPRLSGEVVAVKFDVGDHTAMAVPVDTLRAARKQKG
jgi:hypothetical protein